MMDVAAIISGILAGLIAAFGSWGAVRYEMGQFKGTIDSMRETTRQHHERLRDLERGRKSHRGAEGGE